MSAAVADAIERLDALAGEQGVELRADVPLAPLTTLRVGGSADRLAAPASVDELVATIKLAHEAGVPAFLLGKGSDIVVADAGIRGLVVRIRADAATIDGTTLIAEAGASMTALAKRCAEAGLAGFDWAISIPGSVGGAVWANAGAHGGEMAQVVREVEVLGADGAAHAYCVRTSPPSPTASRGSSTATRSSSARRSGWSVASRRRSVRS